VLRILARAINKVHKVQERIDEKNCDRSPHPPRELRKQVLHVALRSFRHGPRREHDQRKPKDEEADVQHECRFSPRRINMQPSKEVTGNAGNNPSVAIIARSR